MPSPKQQKLLAILAAIMSKKTSMRVILVTRLQVIIPFSYSTLKNGPAKATLANLQKAISVALSSSGIIVICEGCSHPFTGAEKVEWAHKKAMLDAAGVTYIVTRPIINSIDEVRAVKEALDQRGMDYSRVCLVTCGFHSWAVWLLAKMILLSKQVVVYSNSYELEVQPDHPTPDQQTWGRWLWCSTRRLGLCVTAYVLVPLRRPILDWAAKIRHKAAHE